MELLGLDLNEFRRFEAASIEFQGDPIAIVGPNEAGKSSLLIALTRLNTDAAFEPGDLRRGSPRSGGRPVLIAWFGLDKNDRAAIGHIKEARLITRFQVVKHEDGRLLGRLNPEAKRDQKGRRKVQALLGRVRASLWATEHEAIIDEHFDVAGQVLASTEETLATGGTDALANLADALQEETTATNPALLRDQLRTLVAYERAPHPQDAAVAVLMPRRPSFLMFDQEVRELSSSYDLATQAAAPPPALRNFAKLGDLSLTDAAEAASRSDFGALETMGRAANVRLNEVFSTSWRQSVMSVQVRLDRAELRPMVQNLSGQFTELGERSDGLKMFVALVGYLGPEDRPIKPVLLIDEAETHLHYDAQADLVRVLSTQDAAAKVIYSTHSAGCLPLDLGSGIRVLQMKPGDRSEVENSFWELGPGYSPMVMAMGANALAFTPTRRAAIGEGATEAILLPTLLREAVPANELDYQVAPGLSSATREAIRDLDLEAARVAFIVDGDKGGDSVRAKTESSGVPADRVVDLAPAGSGITIEDLVKPDAFRKAVNAELAVWKPGREVPAVMVPVNGRSKALTTWCRRRGFEPPDKKRIAVRLLAMARRERITTSDGRRLLVELHRQIRLVLDRSAFTPPPGISPPSEGPGEASGAGA